MSKTVRCTATGVVGTTDTFYRKGQKYYASREIYLQHKSNLKKGKSLSAEQDKIYALICEYILGIKTEARRPPTLAKMLRPFKAYDPEVVCLAIEMCGARIAEKIKEPRFNSGYGQLNYVVAALRNEMNYAENVHRQKKFQEKRDAARIASAPQAPIDYENFGKNVKHPKKDMTKLFQEDEQ